MFLITNILYATPEKLWFHEDNFSGAPFVIRNMLGTLEKQHKEQTKFSWEHEVTLQGTHAGGGGGGGCI
jgi:hypothetical protein